MFKITKRYIECILLISLLFSCNSEKRKEYLVRIISDSTIAYNQTLIRRINEKNSKLAYPPPVTNLDFELDTIVINDYRFVDKKEVAKFLLKKSLKGNSFLNVELEVAEKFNGTLSKEYQELAEKLYDLHKEQDSLEQISNDLRNFPKENYLVNYSIRVRTKGGGIYPVASKDSVFCVITNSGAILFE